MNREIPQHQKIRFRRTDAARLDRLPSAIPPPIKTKRFRWKRLCFIVAAVPVVLLCVIIALIESGAGNDRLRHEAQNVLSALAGNDFVPSIGMTEIGFDGLSMLQLEASDVRLVSRLSDEDLVQLGLIRFGLQLTPLLRGELRIGSVSLSNIRLDLGELPGVNPDAMSVFDRHGLLDTDALIAAIFAETRQIIAVIGARDVQKIRLKDVEIELVDDRPDLLLHVKDALLERDGDHGVKLSATVTFDGRKGSLVSSAALSEDGKHVEVLAFTLNTEQAGDEAPAPGDIVQFGEASLTVDGSQTSERDYLHLSSTISDLFLAFDKDEVTASFAVDALLQTGANKVEIEKFQIGTGRSVLNFNGAIGPVPEGESLHPAYRFELVSDGSRLAPSDSPEASLPIVARVAGNFDVSASNFNIEQIGVRSGAGEVRGNASIRLVPEKSPAVSLRLDVTDMPVWQVKQLWPWASAPSARKWVLANVFGGRVEKGWVNFGVPAGRLGNGVPLNRDEVSGHFTIKGTRFDVAGRIPAFRDGNGAVDFRGTDVDISLESGTVFLPRGRTVDARNGTLAIRDAHINPVIGKLRIDVAGKADAVMALASYEPIDVERFIDLKPDEISGDVKGEVQADIPLQKSIPLESLYWRVALDYSDLALSRPFDGQAVSQAQGSIIVDPSSATIDARASINRAPASVKLVEPLGQSDAKRSRHISVQLDDKGRQAIAPGLNDILSGVAQVDIDDSTASQRLVKVGLDKATLSLPWLGWSKGRGVAGNASFRMETNGSQVNLSDFRLSGESFGAQGNLSIVGGALSKARFTSAQLSRGDSFSVDVAAQGRGYNIKVRGKSVDARSLIKLHLGGGGDAQQSEIGSAVTLDLAVDAMTGFHREILHNVKLNYSGGGSAPQQLQFTATTANGHAINFTDGYENGTRKTALSAADAGVILRFLDIYEHVEGGTLALSLAGKGKGPLGGSVDLRNFWVVDEPRLDSLVSTTPRGDNRSLNQAVRGKIDTKRVQFERGFSHVTTKSGTLTLADGVLRGPLIGLSFQGQLYDRKGNIAMTGTFMPAYGINRIFGDIPLLGQILGNGRDGGLIGITFRVSGKMEDPQLDINPLSAIAPGIFRSVFEFR